MPKNPARVPGRTTKLTPEVEAGILLAIRAGASFVVAAGSQGVSQATFYEWMARGEGRDNDRPEEGKEGLSYAAFAEKVRKAEHETHVRVIGTLTQASMRDWGAAKNWLKLRHPEMYAERSEITGAGGGAIEVKDVTVGMDDHERAALRKVLDEILAEGESVE